MFFYLVVFSTSLTCVLSLALGLFTIFKNPKSLVHLFWFLTTLLVATWSLNYLIVLFINDDTKALFYLRILYIAVSFLPVVYFTFITRFLNLYNKYKKIISAGYLLAIVFSVLVVYTRLIFLDVGYLEGFGRYNILNHQGFLPFLIYFGLFVFMSFALLLKEYGSSDGIKKKQIFYLLLSGVCGFIGGSTNYATSFLGIYPYGQLFVWLYPLLVTYGIFVDEIKIKISL